MAIATSDARLTVAASLCRACAQRASAIASAQQQISALESSIAKLASEVAAHESTHRPRFTVIVARDANLSHAASLLTVGALSQLGKRLEIICSQECSAQAHRGAHEIRELAQ